MDLTLHFFFQRCHAIDWVSSLAPPGRFRLESGAIKRARRVGYYYTVDQSLTSGNSDIALDILLIAITGLGVRTVPIMTGSNASYFAHRFSRVRTLDGSGG